MGVVHQTKLMRRAPRRSKRRLSRGRKTGRRKKKSTHLEMTYRIKLYQIYRRGRYHGESTIQNAGTVANKGKIYDCSSRGKNTFNCKTKEDWGKTIVTFKFEFQKEYKFKANYKQWDPKQKKYILPGKFSGTKVFSR